MSDLERLLESVAEECSETSADYAAIGPILKRRLLPLLLAGQALEKNYTSLLMSDYETSRNRYPDEKEDSIMAYRAAKQKALEP